MATDDYPRDALKPGHQLLWYKIEKVLGEGGFGITYLAHDVNLDKKVAIKEYLPSNICYRNDDQTIAPNTSSLDDFETGLNRFIREARTVAKFEHPNIVKVTNVFEENKTAYMAMAYEKGKDLKTLVTPRKTLDEDHLFSIMIPILEGLEYVHETGFIHRDIKPGNIMIRQDGSPVLIDFGSAHNTNHSKASVTTLVSPGYTPHEQYVGKPELQGPWSDIYSLAATMYRCVCGINPIDAITRGSALIKQEADPLQAAATIGDEERYNKNLLKAIDHGLAFNEKDRPQNVREWREELLGHRLVEKGDTLNEGNFLNSITRSHKSEKTIELTPGGITTPIKKSGKQYAIIAGVAVLAITVGLTIFNKEDNNPEDIKQNKPVAVINEAAPITEVATTTSSDSTSTIESNESPDIAKDETDDAIDTEITDKLSDGSPAPALIVIPQGSNVIGSSNEEEGHRADESPQRVITMKQAVALGKTEVTVGQFKKFVAATGYLTEAELDSAQGCRTFEQGWDWRPGRSWRNPGYEQEDSHPVVCVSWHDAMEYVKWLSVETGKPYQLPSESVWEYASRAGTTTSRFWGDEKACDYSNVSDFSRAAMHNLNVSSKNIFSCEDGNAYSAKVASFKPNPYGLYDTIGNVWEWTLDCWNENHSNINEDGSPRLSGNCNNRIYRGGSWGNLPSLVRAAKRLTDPSHFRYYNLCFRVSRTVDS